MQLPQTYTTIVHKCYIPVVVQKLLCAYYTHPLHSDLVVLSCKMSLASMHTKTACNFHTDRAATMHLLRPQQDWRQASNITLNGIVANPSRALLVESSSVASNFEQRPLCTMTVTTIVDCWLHGKDHCTLKGIK